MYFDDTKKIEDLALLHAQLFVAETKLFFVCECGMRNAVCMLMYTDVISA